MIEYFYVFEINDEFLLILCENTYSKISCFVWMWRHKCLQRWVKAPLWCYGVVSLVNAFYPAFFLQIVSIIISRSSCLSLLSWFFAFLTVVPSSFFHRRGFNGSNLTLLFLTSGCWELRKPLFGLGGLDLWPRSIIYLPKLSFYAISENFSTSSSRLVISGLSLRYFEVNYLQLSLIYSNMAYWRV